MRESVAAGTIRIAKEDSNTNIADMLTKMSQVHDLRICVREFYFRIIQNHHLSHDVFAGTN